MPGLDNQMRWPIISGARRILTNFGNSLVSGASNHRQALTLL